MAGSSPLFRRLFDSLLQSLRSIPSLGWVPLFLFWLGIHETSKIALIAVGVFFPVYLNFLSGILQVDRKLLEVGQIFKLTRTGELRRVILPAALPAYLVGLRSGLGLGWMFVVALHVRAPGAVAAPITIFSIRSPPPYRTSCHGKTENSIKKT